MDEPLSVSRMYADDYQAVAVFSDGTMAFYETEGSGRQDGLRSFQLHQNGKLVFFANIDAAHRPQERSHRMLEIRTGLTQEQAARYWEATVTHIQKALQANPKPETMLILAEKHVVSNGRADREDLSQGRMDYLPEYED